jgi:hypothetical protein
MQKKSEVFLYTSKKVAEKEIRKTIKYTTATHTKKIPKYKNNQRGERPL